MKRREALRNIVVVSSGSMILSSCDFESFKVYDNLPFEKSQFRLIRDLQKLILPKTGEIVDIKEDTLDYSLSVLNDCYDKEDIEKYLKGLMEFETHLKEKFNSNFAKLEDEQKWAMISNNGEVGNPKASDEWNYFLKTTKNLAVENFTQSQNFLVNQMEYEYMPNRYIGCAQV